MKNIENYFTEKRNMTNEKHAFFQNEDENVILEKAVANRSCWKFDFRLFEGPFLLDWLRFSRKIVARKRTITPPDPKFTEKLTMSPN